MGTRWRRFRTNKLVRILTFLLAITTISTSVLVLQLGRLKNINVEYLLVPKYEDSKQFQEDVLDIIDKISKMTYSNNEIKDVDYLYYIKDGLFLYSNTDQDKESYYIENTKVFYFVQSGKWTEGETGKRIKATGYINNRYTGYLGFTQEYFSLRQEAWNQAREVLLPYLIIFASLAIFGILLIAFLINISGLQQQDKTVQLRKIDKIYTDILLLLTSGFVYLFFLRLQDVFNDDEQIGFRMNRGYIEVYTNFEKQFLPSAMFFIAIIAVITTVLTFLLLSLVRKWKASIFIKHSIIYKLLHKLYQVLKEIYQYLFYGDLFKGVPLTKTLYYRQLILIVSTISMFGLAIFLSIMQTGLFLLPLILGIAVVYWYAEGNNKIYNDIESNIKGNLSEAMKSEQTKIALITNVSHDLKTPLTSIISYIELLSKEEGISETAADYIRILQSKSDRLKNIVTDLFELAKSTSGDITMEYDVIDLHKLMEQTLVEMEDKITSSGIQIKTSFPESQVNVKTEGKRLYRVFQNVIDNALKYTMQGTRVYFELAVKDNKAIATVKNIANYEMDFTSEEILQRFVRGDKARSEEGSGLGLSIAESFTRVCGGDFKVEIDGDLFKVLIIFDLVNN